ncbi:MAG: elongation factor Tsf [Saliniramus fredricksonii]|uniref:Elongation factor Ts n=1 Tax=Saliniramus fredricksonii TaxID=1653334 RepID=A0A0P8A172_9HYPH|nr:translation elongation factor Ts [Saliniramus fredricksonii]KPQ08905.1 MAG: elongation factor Tsf [Saliniramus fredricksonii]SCC79099.1 elongation factor Ts [Saliniramus fredricksonii]
MANISAALVKELRDKTGAGMMDCKKALGETDGDIEAAVDWLRTKGLAKAAKKAGRVAAEGLVGIAVSGSQAAVVEVNSETDFVARNEQFQGFVAETAKAALATDGSLEALQAAKLAAGASVEDTIKELIATIGENMTLRRVDKVTVPDGVVAAYMHNAVAEGLGKIGVLVALESTGDKAFLNTLGRQIAMHVAAVNPIAVDASGVDAATIERESAILREKNAGKPDHVMAKIVESGVKSYLKEVTLLDQPFVHDSSKTVAQVLKEAESKAGAPVTLTGFVRYALGEGIEKEESDFAAEVAAQAGVKG